MTKGRTHPPMRDCTERLISYNSEEKASLGDKGRHCQDWNALAEEEHSLKEPQKEGALASSANVGVPSLPTLAPVGSLLIGISSRRRGHLTPIRCP